MNESTHSSRGNRWSSVGYLHDPTTNVDRIHVETDHSLDEAPIIRLSGPQLAPTTFVAAETARDDAEALDLIAQALAENGNADAWEAVASIVRETGRVIADADEPSKRWTYVVAVQGVFLSPEGFDELESDNPGETMRAPERDDDGDVFWTSEIDALHVARVIREAVGDGDPVCVHPFYR